MVRVHCNQILMDMIKHDTDWETINKRYNLLKFMALNEKTILDQTEYQYPIDTVYEQ